MEADRKQQNPTENMLESGLTGLTPLQEQAAIMLASGDSITQVAEKLGLNRSTIYEWQRKITFKCFFNFQRQEAKDTLRNGLAGLYNDALEAVKGCLASENESIRLKAAMWIIGKIEDNPIEDTDARQVLKREATKDMVSWETTKLDEREYQKLLAENGLK